MVTFSRPPALAMSALRPSALFAPQVRVDIDTLGNGSMDGLFAFAALITAQFAAVLYAHYWHAADRWPDDGAKHLRSRSELTHQTAPPL